VSRHSCTSSSDPEFVTQVSEDLALLQLVRQQCASYAASYLRRGLFRADELFSISSVAVAGHSLDALGGPALSQIDLPPISYSGIPLPLAVTPEASPAAEPTTE
jgi:hypothetical protein